VYLLLLAGWQALFNPLTHPGIAPPTDLTSTHGIIMLAMPTPACANSSR
jgi:hypothetical protein